MNLQDLVIRNNQAVGIDDVPRLSFEEFRQALFDGVAGTCHVSALFVHDNLLIAVLVDDANGDIRIFSTEIGSCYPSLTTDCPAVHWFEREIYEQTGVVPEGHPWLKPIRFVGKEPAVADYFTLSGDGAHEVAVGPVHAGVIEPGHFRFQCLGEDVHTLEISLGYQHRGIEDMLKNGPDVRTIHIMETIAGDSSAAYAGAYSAILCALDVNARISPRAQAVRRIAWELERIANHTGDLGALAGDVAFLPTASFCGRIRGDFLNMTAAICGNRFGRGLVVEGGVGYDISDEKAASLLVSLKTQAADLHNALELMFDAPTVLDRFEGTGAVSASTAKEIGLVGMAARASGLSRDVRSTHAYGGYEIHNVQPALGKDGDVLARASVRRLELEQSIAIVGRELENLPVDAQDNAPKTLAPNAIAVALAEGWRGEICHVAITDEKGKFARYKTVDPSFHNWFGLAMALRNEQISNFPICNKSFNLSYCGHDL